jgi:hypothetical protein
VEGFLYMSGVFVLRLVEVVANDGLVLFLSF